MRRRSSSARARSASRSAAAAGTFSAMDDSLLRKLSAAVGLGTVAFGVFPIVSPRAFAAVFGLRRPADATTEAAFRSLGVRDLAIGLGLWSAATHGGRYAPWLLARAISD